MKTKEQIEKLVDLLKREMRAAEDTIMILNSRLQDALEDENEAVVDCIANAWEDALSMKNWLNDLEDVADKLTKESVAKIMATKKESR